MHELVGAQVLNATASGRGSQSSPGPIRGGVRGAESAGRPRSFHDHGAGSADRWGADAVLVFARRRWRCPEPLCQVRIWSERVDAIAARSSLTGRARARVARMVSLEEFSIAAAAVEFGVGWHTANIAVADSTDPHVNDPARLEGVSGIGADEKRFLYATATHRTVFTTQIVDLNRHRLLDVVEGRSRDVLAGWLAERGPDCATRSPSPHSILQPAIAARSSST